MIRNRAMRNFLILSVALHACVILCFTDIIPARKHMHRIEVDLRHPRARRDIPRLPKTTKPANIQQMEIARVYNIECKEIKLHKFPDTIAESIRQDNIRSLVVAQLPANAQFPAWYDFGPHDPLAYYLNLVRQQIDQHKRYPLFARKKHIEGLVGLKFVISRDGSVKGIHVVQSSRYSVLDEAAVDAVKNANPFPPFPKEIKISLLTVEVPVSFQLVEAK